MVVSESVVHNLVSVTNARLFLKLLLQSCEIGNNLPSFPNNLI